MSSISINLYLSAVICDLEYIIISQINSAYEEFYPLPGLQVNIFLFYFCILRSL